MNYDFPVLSDIDFEQMVNKLLNGKTRVGSVKVFFAKIAKRLFRHQSPASSILVAATP